MNKKAMFKSLSKYLIRRSGKLPTLISILVFFLFIFIVLPHESDKMASYSGESGSPDLYFIYNPDLVFQIADIYGESGRQEYIRSRMTFDIVWPIVYAFFLITAISAFWRRHPDKWPSLKVLNLMPIAAVIFDQFENLGAAMVMMHWPQKSLPWALTAAIATPLKWILVGTSFLLLLLLWISALFKRSVNP